MNGKPGDHPLTDLFSYGKPVFSPEIDALLREIQRLAGPGSREWRRLEDEVDWFGPPPLDQLERLLRDRRDRLKRQAEERGWDVE